MRIAALLLCHDAPLRVAKALATPFYDSPDVKLYVHYDARRSADEAARLHAALARPGRRVQLLGERLRCAWGTFSLVEATRRLLRAALDDASFAPDYLLLQSGTCVPMRPLSSLQAFLRERAGTDFIEAVDVVQRRWVRDGLEHERYQLYFPFNYQHHRRAFEWATAVQQRLGVRRAAPEGLRIHFGSQWFCLTRATAAAVCAGLEEAPLRAFFARAWIPDEFAIQTLVARARPAAALAGHNLTYTEFDAAGQPLVLDNGHLDHLRRQPFFFARKLSAHANGLRAQLADIVAQPEADLSYFAQVGRPTPDYQRFVARAAQAPAVRCRVGAWRDAARRGVMDLNGRAYYVLYGASRSYLLALTRAARALAPELPLFDYVFDPQGLAPAAGHAAWFGIDAGMRARRDWDPGGFLHELVHASPAWPSAFALDASLPSPMRAYTLNDANATIVGCDPPALTRMQIADAVLREDGHAGHASLLARTVQAAHDAQWLPQQHYEQVRESGKYGCQFKLLFGIADDDACPVLRALKAAMQRVPVVPHYRAAAEAEAAVRGAAL